MVRQVVANKKTGLGCPECNTGDQIYRKNRQTGDYFIGCTNWPQCRWTANIPDAVINKQFEQLIRKEIKQLKTFVD